MSFWVRHYILVLNDYMKSIHELSHSVKNDKKNFKINTILEKNNAPTIIKSVGPNLHQNWKIRSNAESMEKNEQSRLFWKFSGSIIKFMSEVWKKTSGNHAEKSETPSHCFRLWLEKPLKELLSKNFQKCKLI